MSKLPTRQQVVNVLQAMPGKRGVNIPADMWDQIHASASGITKQVWGSAPSPEQMQRLYDDGHHEPDAIKEVFNGLPHPHAPSLTVGEYPQFSQALQLYQDHHQ